MEPMLSSGPRRARRTASTTAVLLALAIPFLSGSSAAQSFVAAASDDAVLRPIVAAIEAEQLANGPFSERLVVPLTELGREYQDRGEHALAAAAIERTLQVVRANRGLYSLDQAPLLRQLIAGAEAVGDSKHAWDLEVQLLDLARRNPADPESATIHREVAENRLGVLERYEAGEHPPQIVLGCFYDRRPPNSTLPRKCTSGSRGAAIRALRYDAWRHYRAAIDVLLRNDPLSAEARELEMEIVRGSYRYRDRFAGRRSLSRLAGYDAAHSNSSLVRITSQVRLADWDLLFDAPGPTLRLYEQAYEDLRRHNVDQASIDELFAPDIPVVLPDFLPNPFAVAPDPERYIDVALEITRYGLGRKIEILDTSAGVTRAEQQALVRLIKGSRFRPRLTDGRFEDTGPIRVRYYVQSESELEAVRTLDRQRSEPWRARLPAATTP